MTEDLKIASFDQTKYDNVTVYDSDTEPIWEGTRAGFAELLEAIRNRVPIPWCAEHDCLMLTGDTQPYCWEAFNSGDPTIAARCRLEEPQQVYRIK